MAGEMSFESLVGLSVDETDEEVGLDGRSW
jgi:hypothetical protein